MERFYEIHIPKAYDKSKPIPVVLVFMVVVVIHLLYAMNLVWTARQIGKVSW